MKRFKNILYVLDSEIEQEIKVADKVCHLARLNAAKVTIVRLAEQSFIESFGKSLSQRFAKLCETELSHLEQELQHFVRHSRWENIDTSYQILTGKDFIQIIQHVISNEHDLVVKGGNTTEANEQLAMRLFRKCPCPVWIIQPSESPNFKGVLAALDATNQHAESIQLNKKIVELASSLAKIEQGEAHYVHSWFLDFEDMLRSPRFDVPREEIQDAKDELQQAGVDAVGSILNSAGIEPPPGNIHILEGETSDVITRTINDYNIDTLVMGTVARSGVPGLLIGNKAEKVLSQVKCTVLAVKPDGFITPVKL